jgi:hypothetical protein
MDGCDEVSKTGTSIQAGRVVTARIAQKVATSRQVLKMSDELRSMPQIDQVLIVWERDDEPGDTAPGQPNLVELVIYAPHKRTPGLLMELRPLVDPSLVASMDEPAVLYLWIDRFRAGQDIVQPPIVLMNGLGGVHFDVDEYVEPQGIGGVVQQNVRTILCVSPPEIEPDVFFGTATRRYVTGTKKSVTPASTTSLPTGSEGKPPNVPSSLQRTCNGKTPRSQRHRGLAGAGGHRDHACSRVRLVAQQHDDGSDLSPRAFRSRGPCRGRFVGRPTTQQPSGQSELDAS